MPQRNHDRIVRQGLDEHLGATSVFRKCMSGNGKRVIGAWMLYEDISNRFPLTKRWLTPQSPSPPACEVRVIETESKGRGLFATRDIKRGEIIIRERPVIIVPSSSKVDPDPKTPYKTMDRNVEQLVSWLEKEDQEEFLKLHNCKSPEECGNLTGITRTNGLGAIFKTSKILTAYTAVCLKQSYANHSCERNAAQLFDEAEMTKAFYATRDIAEGEEITISYIAKWQTRRARREELETKYKFTCECTLCARGENLRSDINRQLISQWLENDTRLLNALLDTPAHQRAEKAANHIEFLSLVLQAMIDEKIEEKRILIVQHLAFIYGHAGDLENFRKYGRMCIDAFELTKDFVEEDRNIHEMWKDFVRNPSSYWAWNAWR